MRRGPSIHNGNKSLYGAEWFAVNLWVKMMMSAPPSSTDRWAGRPSFSPPLIAGLVLTPALPSVVDSGRLGPCLQRVLVGPDLPSGGKSISVPLMAVR